MGLTDGLGFEEVNQTTTSTATISGTNVYGATSVQTATTIATTVSGTDARVGNDLTVGSSVYQGLNDTEGLVVNNITAEAIISGGMWVMIDEGHITNVAVHPEYRGIGLGNVVIEKLIAIAKEENLVAMTLEVRVSNFTAINLYRKYGFIAPPLSGSQ